MLYRESWGSTPWTRIEQTAIRSRAFDEGYNFTLFIKMDDSSTPRWLPPTQIYFDYERFGEQGAAAVISAKIVELSGTPKPYSATEEAKRMEAELKFKQESHGWMHSDVGVRNIADAVKEIGSKIKNQIDEIRIDNPTTELKIDQSQGTDFSILHRSSSMTFDLKGRAYANMVGNTHLKVRHWNDLVLRSRSNEWYGEEPDLLLEYDFIPSLGRDGRVIWTLDHDKTRSFGNDTLIEFCMKTFMKKITE